MRSEATNLVRRELVTEDTNKNHADKPALKVLGSRNCYSISPKPVQLIREDSQEILSLI